MNNVIYDRGNAHRTIFSRGNAIGVVASDRIASVSFTSPATTRPNVNVVSKSTAIGCRTARNHRVTSSPGEPQVPYPTYCRFRFLTSLLLLPTTTTIIYCYCLFFSRPPSCQKILRLYVCFPRTWLRLVHFIRVVERYCAYDEDDRDLSYELAQLASESSAVFCYIPRVLLVLMNNAHSLVTWYRRFIEMDGVMW